MLPARQYSKKVLFLYPHSVFQEQLLNVLVQAEFEVALVSDHTKLPMVLYRFPESIVFVNIESPILKSKEWEAYIGSLIQTHEKHKAVVGIMAYNPDREVATRYLMEIGVQCGFIGLKLGITESAKILLKTLDANEARGDRKFVRVKCNPQKTSMNIAIAGKLVSGELLDISSAGCSCNLPAHLPNGTVLDDIQLKLWGALVKVQGTVMGTRALDENNEIHVIMFDDKLDRQIKAKIYTFIQKSVQAEVDSVIQS